mmetsp:Transcript_87703/g.249523  ORF Transcript_87703/g.249523 Transcript_87703/m.249523 type:complete len:138 (+) Transcript_87703:556-969(+)
MAKRFAECPSLKFVKIDGAENELSYVDAPEVPEVRSYPTLLHFKRDQATGERIRVPVKYPFALTPNNVDRLADYILANVSQPFFSYGTYYGNDCDLCSEFQVRVLGKCLRCAGSKVFGFVGSLFAPKEETSAAKQEL